MQSLPITKDVLWRGGREKRLEQEEQNRLRDEYYKQNTSNEALEQSEARSYAWASDEERQKLDQKKLSYDWSTPTPSTPPPSGVTVPQKRRGGTIKKRYAKGGGIRKPKGF